MKLARKLAAYNFFFLVIITCFSCLNDKEVSTYDYKTFQNAPFDLKVYTLENGLQLYLVPTKDEPKIETRIVINAGSMHEPNNGMGLAHYLEHLLFNGTDSIGGFNFEKEKPLLNSITALYEQHRKTTDPVKKQQIYKQIDSLSFEASKYSNKNEFTDIMVKMGISYMNAFTRPDMTVYMNEIPSNQLEKWIMLEAERFRNPQFRGFHTELETVYEEFNSLRDNGYQLAKMKLYEIMFPDSEFYNETIGTSDYLRNPSLVETKKFFDTYYVPNNMAIILAGDFDPDQATQFIEERFGDMKYQALPESKKSSTPFLKSNKNLTIATSEGESLAMGYIGVAPKNEDAYLAEFIEMLFLNGNVDLVNTGEVESNSQWLNSRPIFYKDFTLHYIEAATKGNSLEELESLIIRDINRLKTGDFPNWLLGAVANDLKNRFTSAINSNNNIVHFLTNAFVHEVPIETLFLQQKKFEQVTKSDIKKYAEKYYNHYSIVYKKQGESKVENVSKPAITSLSDLNEKKESEFARKIASMKADPIKPLLLDFEKDIEKIPLNNTASVNFVKNQSDELFKLRIIFEKGKEDKTLQLANEYIQLAGSDQYSSKEFKNELYKLGCNFRMKVEAESTTLAIDGLSDNLEKALQLILYFLPNLKVDSKTLESVRQTELTEIENQKNNKFRVLGRAMNYVKYGPEVAFQGILTKQDIEEISAEMIVDKMGKLFNDQHKIYLYGANTKQEVANIFNKVLEQNTLKSIEAPLRSKSENYKENNVFLIDFKSTQLHAVFTTKLKSYAPEHTAMNALFYEYFNSLINNELREKRGLVYSANCDFLDDENTKPNHFYTQMSTQIDKYIEALKINHDLLRDIPFDESLFLKSKARRQGIWNSWRVVKNDVLSHYENSLNRGFDHDYRKQYYDEFPNVTLEDLKKYYQEWIKDNPFNLIIIGDLTQIDKTVLKEYGKINVLTIEELFRD